jgi:demethylmenaquinone methyltransferase/2-methoxy-6-polyprenyl-1,4-benzoquinol methylase
MAMNDRPGTAESGERTSFGFREVATADKQRLVDAVFDRVASRYDLMNDLMSGGMHRLWKDAMVAWLAPARQAGLPFRVLDLAGGTGDVATRIARASDGARVVVGDINRNMLAEGERRAETAGLSDRLSFVEANAEELPFDRGSFDAVTIAFGIRNVPRVEKALSEIYRVLKPGGRFLCLEFSTVDVAGLDRLYDLFSFHVIPRLGGIVAGDRDSYQYLVESIRRFPNQTRFADMIRAAGFRRVEHRNLTGGIAAIHSGWKV